MQNNSVEIDRYLLNEMSEENKAAFEKRLADEPSIREELRIQQSIIDSAIDAGIKMEFTSAMKSRISMRRLYLIAAVFTGMVFVIGLYYSNSKKTDTLKPNLPLVNNGRMLQKRFVNPPDKTVDVPMSEFYFDASKGDTIFSNTGSILCFPAGSLLDEAGKTASGIVTLQFREFKDPADFFLSGIPMSYDSAGKRFNFESSVMCDIVVYKNKKPLSINKAISPTVYLTSLNKNPAHNLYYLDTIARKWVFEGKDEILNINKKSTVNTTEMNTRREETTAVLPVKPILPSIATEGKQAFSIEIEPGSFEELFAYHGLKFELLEKQIQLQSEADEHWDDVKLQKTNIPGVFKVTFTNKSKSVSYQVKPVLEGKDYDAALKDFEQKDYAYKLALQNRMIQQQNSIDSIKKIKAEEAVMAQAENERIENINQLIRARNKSMRENRQKVEQEMLRQEALVAQQQIINDAAFAKQVAYFSQQANDIDISNNIMRSFSLNRFGIWNCDHPQYPQLEIQVVPSFSSSPGDTIMFSQVAVVYKNFNGITQYPYNMPIRVIPGDDNMLWAIHNKQLYYYTYKDFKNSGINRNSFKYHFEMRKAEIEFTGYDAVKGFLNTL